MDLQVRAAGSASMWTEAEDYTHSIGVYVDRKLREDDATTSVELQT